MKITPHQWQKACATKAAAKIANSDRAMFIVAGTGAGKTVAGLLCFAKSPATKLLVITTKSGVRGPWAKDSALMGLDMTLINSPASLHSNAQVLVANVQKLRKMIGPVLEFCAREKVMLLADECQHHGEGNTWFDIVKKISDNAFFSIGMSATPMRSDRARVLFMAYEKLKGTRASVAKPDVDFPFHLTVAAGLASPVVHRFVGGRIEKTFDYGRRESYDFKDGDYSHINGAANHSMMAARLRLSTVESLDWQMYAVEKARDTLMAFREDGRPWAGLIVCHKISQAKRIAQEITRKWGDNLRLVVGDVDTMEAVQEIEGDDRIIWVVSITKVSEGVSINRLRVGAYLSPVTADSTLDQVRGRFARRMDGLPQLEKTGVFFLPADPRIIAWASERNRLLMDAAPWITGGDPVEQYRADTVEAQRYTDTVLDDAKTESRIIELRQELSAKAKVFSESFTINAKTKMEGAVVSGKFISEADYAAMRENLIDIIGPKTALGASVDVIRILTKALA